jgi:CTP synthase
MDSECEHPVIALIAEWRGPNGEVEQRDESSDLGGTMRLGAQECRLDGGSMMARMYGSEVIRERHRHRYEFNNFYIEILEKNGLKFVGKSLDGGLVEVVELPNHPWFVAVQFHPEFTSTPRDGHPLFKGFIAAAHAHKSASRSAVASA